MYDVFCVIWENWDSERVVYYIEARSENTRTVVYLIFKAVRNLPEIPIKIVYSFCLLCYDKLLHKTHKKKLILTYFHKFDGYTFDQASLLKTANVLNLKCELKGNF